VYLTVRQVAERIQMSEKTVRRRIQDGSLKACYLTQKTIRIPEEALSEFLCSKQTGKEAVK